MPKSSSSKTKARVLSSKVAYRGPAFWVSTDELIEPTGIRVRRDIVHHSGSVVILAIEESRSEIKVLLERQYRHAAQQFLWELPAGRIDKGENELKAAKRELLEETGFAASRWKRILKFYVSPGFVAETMSVFLATGLRPGTAQPEDDEVIEVRFVSLAEALRMVLSGKIKDAKTIAGVFWLSHERDARKPRR
jgi:ADP-ribose pyrophosphatase